ncbi:MAG: DUF3467 domain-containing protein [Chloroherpetonaceae bacterium]|nr:DUF3467 domain-containing protein [Chloroherpetonaceae bacterium]
MNETQQPFQINIELDEKVAEGSYSNLVILNHTPAEFILDFTKILPGVMKAKVSSRIIMHPQHAKALLMALQENISKYESAFGQIKLGTSPLNEPMGFRVGGKENLS